LVEIRKLPLPRWEDYRRLRLESLRRSPLAFGSAFEEEAERSEAQWKKWMKNVSFAMVEDVPVGMIVCSFTRETKFRHVAEIYSFYVREAYRGRGVGAALFGHALRAARDNLRIEKVRLYVNTRQRSALRMYGKAGFVVVGRFARDMKVDGKYYTMLAMEKRVR